MHNKTERFMQRFFRRLGNEFVVGGKNRSAEACGEGAGKQVFFMVFPKESKSWSVVRHGRLTMRRFRDWEISACRIAFKHAAKQFANSFLL